MKIFVQNVELLPLQQLLLMCNGMKRVIFPIFESIHLEPKYYNTFLFFQALNFIEQQFFLQPLNPLVSVLRTYKSSVFSIHFIVDFQPFEITYICKRNPRHKYGL